MKNIIVYDFDKTIYGGETSTDFMRFFLKRNPKYIFKIYKVIHSLMYYRSDLKKSKEIFFEILSNIEIEYLNKEIHAFWIENKYKIFPWIYEEIKKNKNQAEELILISATPKIFLEEISKELGFDKLIATNFIKQDKYFVSKIEGKNCKHVEKVHRLKEYLQDFNILIFYSDSMSDKPLFDLAQKKYYINKGIKKEGLPNE
ncbi:HAD family hydrolase [Streptobacillus moniliformis]|uniref:HAD-superfamily hydrolase, subfamily IB (PSPase-like) n=1 Tax=Streptobacillus moniliformis (strain ATCC 14647 / DSM 12112 / NCTC 10651 / 9901) TaxID=519441 RepID=D1AVW6_STRM9|nr:HAD family hydrolase [Streptobacillus moniliformis]ACZ01876.1 HAD-superfamily hydrolase, subfamily IB (PSPase- like) [Streptobacillus moniliformis DSM 12112]SQA12918.1 HAD hydrolase, family IB [Streptobacillus moniliformis]